MLAWGLCEVTRSFRSTRYKLKHIFQLYQIFLAVLSSLLSSALNQIEPLFFLVYKMVDHVVNWLKQVIFNVKHKFLTSYACFQTINISINSDLIEICTVNELVSCLPPTKWPLFCTGFESYWGYKIFCLLPASLPISRLAAMRFYLMKICHITPNKLINNINTYSDNFWRNQKKNF